MSVEYKNRRCMGERQIDSCDGDCIMCDDARVTVTVQESG